MRVAFVGKGGAGKSSLAGTFSRLLAGTGERVLALDSDPMPGLAFSLGADRVDHGLPDDVVEEDDAGGRFRLATGLRGVDVVERHAVRGPDGVYFLQLGKARGQWATPSMDGMGGMGGSALSSALSGLGYHYGTGAVIAIAAAYALGVLSAGPVTADPLANRAQRPGTPTTRERVGV